MTANTSGISDPDGLSNPGWTYQWMRETSGMDSNILGATSSTYTLNVYDVGSKVKVRVSFTDDDGTRETLTSDATATVVTGEGAPDPVAGAASVALAVSPSPVSEGSPVRVTATLSAALAEAVSIPLTVTPGTSEKSDHGTLASSTSPPGGRRDRVRSPPTRTWTGTTRPSRWRSTRTACRPR